MGAYIIPASILYLPLKPDELSNGSHMAPTVRGTQSNHVTDDDLWLRILFCVNRKISDDLENNLQARNGDVSL